MTYITEQTPAELRAHIRRLQAMPGWHDPVIDRLFKEIKDLDRQIASLTEQQAATSAPQRQISRVGTNSGHGHVWARPDGVRTRCGGPGICIMCSDDYAHANPQHPRTDGGRHGQD